MIKRIVLILAIIVLTGCFNQNSKFYLEDKYYQEGKYIEININDYKNIENEIFILFTYNSYCQFSVPCDQVFLTTMRKYNISFLSMPYDEFKKTNLHDTVKYAPSVIIVKNGKIVTYLDSESDLDIDLYQDDSKFENWLKKYIYLEKK